MSPAPRAAAAAVVGLALAGCELREITLVDAEDVVVAEVHLQLGGGLFPGDRLTAFLHRTVGGAGVGFHPVPGAAVRVTRSDGARVDLAEARLGVCVESTPLGGTGTCYAAAPADASNFGPGDRLNLAIDLPGGGRLTSATVVPGAFDLRWLADGASCVLPERTPFTVRWSAAKGAWAYINETLITGLPDALGLAPDAADPLYLLGLSISATDTTIVFPGEFGVFNRFELDQEVATALQEGLPARTRATVAISAVDANYVNWVRGGNFNPSGQVRIPSVAGDGTGVFASAIIRTFEVAVDPDTTGAPHAFPACPLL